MSFSLPQSGLFKKADFNALFKEGKRRGGAFFLVYVKKGDSFLSPGARKLGLVVGKKATGNNVKRNQVKRIIRETYRLRQHEFSNMQVLVVAKRGIAKIESHALRMDLDRLLSSFISCAS